MDTDTVKMIQRTLYVIGLLACLAYASIYPSWVGRFYNPDITKPGEYYPGGTFGLKGAVGPRARALIWNPPPAHADDVIHASVRWPWQPVTQHEHIEIDLWPFVRIISLAMIVLGLLVGFSALLLRPGKPDLFIALATSVAFGLILGWIAATGLAMASSGYAPASYYYAIMATCFILGCAFGVFWRFILMPRKHMDELNVGANYTG
jgi:hypothetical protein